MHISFVLPHADLSGGIRTVATYARLLAKRGHKVTAVSTAPWPEPMRGRLRSLLRSAWTPRIPGEAPGHFDGIEVEHRRLRSHGPVTDGDVPDGDVVVATWWLTAEWVAGMSGRKGAKVHFVQGNEVDMPGAPTARIEATWALPLHKIVCSRWLERLARERCSAADVTYVPNGVDLEHFSAPVRGPRERPTVGMVYSDIGLKGCDIAVDAFHRAQRGVPGLRLVVFGSSQVSARVPLPAGAQFVHRPSQDSIPGLYASCDAWLWPSRAEGFGLPILEAMACGTPVIATPAGAAPEILADGGGILLPAADAGLMAEAIERVCSAPAHEWAALSAQARSSAERHGWDRSVQMFEAALQGARPPRD